MNLKDKRTPRLWKAAGYDKAKIPACLIVDDDCIALAGTYEQAGRFDAEAHAHLIAAAPELLALVEQVEWIVSPVGWFGSSVRICPWCQGTPPYGHAPDCPRQAALAKAYGKSLP
jgi:hypothetical protein